MRIIDRLAIRSAKPLPPAAMRNADPTDVHEQIRAHYIDLARYLADVGADPDMQGLKASEARQARRRVAAIEALKAAIPSTSTTHEARMRLLRRSNPNV